MSIVSVNTSTQLMDSIPRAIQDWLPPANRQVVFCSVLPIDSLPASEEVTVESALIEKQKPVAVLGWSVFA
jgi:hypothetical protein